MPEARDQSRSNSGLYLQSRYECQVLDSFALDPMFNGCGSLYRFRAPDVNACFPPLVWQSYDVQFTAPRWAADGTKIRDAHITSWLNGVKVQDDVALPNKTGAGKPEEPLLLPIRLQDHGDPVRFRNIWIVDRGLTIGEFPVYPTKEQLEADARAAAEREAAEKAAEAEAKAKQKAEAKAKREAEAKAKQEAEAKAKQEAEAKAKQEKVEAEEVNVKEEAAKENVDEAPKAEAAAAE
jgi:hypothetical protein